MQIWHQRNLLESNFPFKLWTASHITFGPHWHEEIEIVYMIDGSMQIGLNNNIYTLKEKDILLIGGGDVHYFLPQHQSGKKLLMQFGLSLFDTHSVVMSDRKFIHPVLSHSGKLNDHIQDNIHAKLEEQILLLNDEYQAKQPGYRMALKARLYDLMVILFRDVPMEKYSLQERSKHLLQLERLEKVLQYVEEHYHEEITLQDIAAIANFSVYHFTRFFKEIMGMTFIQYLNRYRVKVAQRYLLDTDKSITVLAYEAGFNSIQTFNRVFKQINGCSPTQYIDNIINA